MRIFDADGHVEESPITFSDDYLDPAFRSQRPRVVGMDGMVYWMIDEQLFPRRVGRGCNNLGTPVSYNGKPALHTRGKTDSVESMELTDIKARLQAMDDEDIALTDLDPASGIDDAFHVQYERRPTTDAGRDRCRIDFGVICFDP